jgi:hypothetical protein
MNLTFFLCVLVFWKLVVFEFLLDISQMSARQVNVLVQLDVTQLLMLFWDVGVFETKTVSPNHIL